MLWCSLRIDGGEGGMEQVEGSRYLGEKGVEEKRKARFRYKS